ncbi:MAG: hypothetical protein AAGA48_23645 [Myxococcota bacterium]
MNCREVRQRLLEIDLDDLESLRPHLACCPECAALVEAFRAAEFALDQQQEDFVNQTATLDAQWALALEQGEEAHPWRSLATGLLALVTVCVVVLALWPNPLPGPETPHPAAPVPLVIEELEQQHDAFDAVQMDPDLEGLDVQAQDGLLRTLLQEKTETFELLKQTVEDIVADDQIEKRWKAEAQLSLAEAYIGLGDSLADSSIPTYLAKNQREFYAMKLQHRADGHYITALGLCEVVKAKADKEGLSRLKSRAVKVRRIADRRRSH